jgi:hypothetical protein
MSMPPGRTEFCETLQDSEDPLIRYMMMPYIPIKRLEVTELIKKGFSSVMLIIMCER